MTEDNLSPVCFLPPEVLFYIFTFLSAKNLIRCRQVCTQWKQIVDGFGGNDTLWQKHCKNDFPSVYKIARYKAHPCLLWYNIYKSLSLWNKLSEATEVLDEFASASSVNKEISSFKILKDGVIGVHKRNSIDYYDIETLQRVKREGISGAYLKYTENEDTIVIMSYNLQLSVIQKIIHNPCLETNVTFDDVKSFILTDNYIYYVNLNEDIYICKLEDLTSEFVAHSGDGIVSLGYSHNKLNLLTFHRNIYTVYENKLIFTCALGPDTNLLHQLQLYNFLEHLDWRIYFQWMFVLNHTVPEGPLRDIITVLKYEDVVFVGSNWGVLRIYYAPYSSGEFDLFNAEPIKQYNFMQRYDCPVLSTCPIVQIDVLETEEGHTVIIAMPKKLALIKFIHNFKQTASVAMVPYKDAQRVNILKIDDSH